MALRTEEFRPYAIELKRPFIQISGGENSTEEEESTLVEEI